MLIYDTSKENSRSPKNAATLRDERRGVGGGLGGTSCGVIHVVTRATLALISILEDMDNIR